MIGNKKKRWNLELNQKMNKFIHKSCIDIIYIFLYIYIK